MFRRILRYVIPQGIPGFAAKLYDELARTARGTYYEELAREIVAVMTRGRILDLGTGPGYLPIEIVKRAPDVRIDAIDLSKKMLEIAQRNAQEAGVADRVTFQVGDANKLRFSDNSYDMVISTGAFHAWQKPSHVINECHRVLKPGKEAWIYDPARISSEEAARLRRQKAARGWGWIAYKWGYLTGRLTTVSLSETYGILSRTNFTHHHVEHRQETIKIILRKEGGSDRT